MNKVVWIKRTRKINLGDNLGGLSSTMEDCRHIQVIIPQVSGQKQDFPGAPRLSDARASRGTTTPCPFPLSHWPLPSSRHFTSQKQAQERWLPTAKALTSNEHGQSASQTAVVSAPDHLAGSVSSKSGLGWKTKGRQERSTLNIFIS